MIFDAFYLPMDIIPNHIKSAYKIRLPSIVIFADEVVTSKDLAFTDGTLSVRGSSFSYLFMSPFKNKDIAQAELLIHQMDNQQWKAQTSAFKATYRNFIDKKNLISEMSGMPFKNDKARIDFFIEEIVFSPREGILPLGLALMDTALQSTLPLCKARSSIKQLPVRS